MKNFSRKLSMVPLRLNMATLLRDTQKHVSPVSDSPTVHHASISSSLSLDRRSVSPHAGSRMVSIFVVRARGEATSEVKLTTS